MSLYSRFLIIIGVSCAATAGVLKQTGDLVLSENLVTVSCNSVALPVTLDYKSGIKLDQRASWAGLGFSLGLPYIERVAVGSADERGYEYEDAMKLVENGDCIPPGVFDLSKVWDPLVRLAGNGYQGDYVFVNTCPGTDLAKGYFSEMYDNYTNGPRYPDDPDVQGWDGEISVGSNGVISAITCGDPPACTMPWPVPIGKTTRPAGDYPSGTLSTWLGTECTGGSVQGVVRREDHKYNNQQDLYFLNAHFGSGRLVFANPPSQSVSLPGGNFTVYSSSEAMTCYLQGYRAMKIVPVFGSRAGGEGFDLVKWEITDENGTVYEFGQSVMRSNSISSAADTRTLGTINAHYGNGQLLELQKDLKSSIL